MGRRKKLQGFTLIELLIVVVIIALIAALLLPAILKALCNARQGTAEHLIDQLSQAAKAYELDFAVYPPGKGDGTKELAYYLQQKGPKKLAYFDFPQDMLSNGHIINPIYADGDPPTNIIYYRNNVAAGGAAGGGGGGGGAAGGPPVYHKSSIDIWCAGCNYTGAVQATQWSVNNWE
jgi:prepilin-type N-terminal cleavage/methylation domain-containing protein